MIKSMTGFASVTREHDLANTLGAMEALLGRLRDLHRDGKRDPRAGTADGWLEE